MGHRQCFSSAFVGEVRLLLPIRMRNETGGINPTPCHRYLEVRPQALHNNLLYRDLNTPSITRPQLLRDNPEGLSKKRGHLDQLIDPALYDIWNHAPMMVSSSIPSHAKLDAKTSCTHTHEKPVWNHVLRVSGDCRDTDAGFSKLWRGSCN